MDLIKIYTMFYEIYSNLLIVLINQSLNSYRFLKQKEPVYYPQQSYSYGSSY